MGGLVLTVVGVGLLPLEGGAELVDRIVAVVDVEPILLSELEEAVWLYRAQMGLSPEDTTGLQAFRREVLNQLIDEKLLVAKAQREGLTAGTKELAQSLDWAVEEMRRSFGSEEKFLEELEKEGLTIHTLKDRYRDIVRQQLLARRVMEQELRPSLTVSPEEVREFFDTHRDSIPQVPDRFHLLAALVHVEAGHEEREAARLRANTVFGMIRNGKDFAEAAAEFSDGPEAVRGGDIGYFRRGDLGHVPEFENLAMSQDAGEFGGPVETQLGFHLVQTTERDPSSDRVRVSQILFLVNRSRADTLRAREAAEEVRRLLSEGSGVDEIRARYAAAKRLRVEAEDLGLVPLSNLKGDYQAAIGKMSLDETSQVRVVPEGLQIIKLIDRVPEHEPAFEEVEQQLTDLVGRRKMEEAYREWMEALRKEIYIKLNLGGP